MGGGEKEYKSFEPALSQKRKKRKKRKKKLSSGPGFVVDKKSVERTPAREEGLAFIHVL